MSRRWSLDQCVSTDRAQRRALASVIPPAERSRVLDLGCGIGRLTGWLAGQAGSDPDGTEVPCPLQEPARVVGTDFSLEMVERAAREVRAGNVEFIHADAAHLPFADDSFDLVVSVGVLQHLVRTPDFRAACSQIARVLAPGGVLVCIEGQPSSQAERRAANGGTSTSTVQRDATAYGDALGTGMTLTASTPLVCVLDEYLVTRWERMAKAGTA
jgi:ubiquinone/menaquinone biosynthesis C-methylase UbiE